MTERIRAAQEDIALALLTARAEEDRELARTVREQGERLAHINYGLLQLTRIHAVTNAAFDHPVAEFARVVGDLVGLLGPVHLVCVEDQIYVNDVRVRFETHPEHAAAFGRLLARHGVGGITYHAPLDDETVRTMVELFAADAAPDDPRGRLERRLVDVGVTTVELHPPFRYRGEDDVRQRAPDEAFLDAAAALDEALANLESGRLVNPLPIRRTVIDIMEATAGGDLVAAVATADRRLPEPARHPVAVTGLSLAVARAVGLPITVAAHVGVAAMLHDTGYAAGGGKAAPFARHGRAALRLLLGQRGFHEARVARLLTVLEHHRRFAGDGDPPSLPARIVHLADDYDRMTRSWSRRPPAAAPPEALRRICGAAGREYDPTLVQGLVNVVGAYPPGSWLRLDDQRTVEVVSGVRRPETFDRPLCRVVDPRTGRLGDEVDLARRGRVAGVVRRPGKA